MRSETRDASAVAGQSPRWRKARASNACGNCVEVAVLATGQVAVRNSRHPHGPVVVYGGRGMAAFVAAVKAGDGEADAARGRPAP